MEGRGGKGRGGDDGRCGGMGGEGRGGEGGIEVREGKREGGESEGGR